MNAGQKQFYDFILERTQAGKQEAVKALLEEGFAKQADGTFTQEYMEEYAKRMLADLKPEHVAEVASIMEQFGKNRVQ